MTQPEQPDDGSRQSADWNAPPSQQSSDQAAPGWYQQPYDPSAYRQQPYDASASGQPQHDPPAYGQQQDDPPAHGKEQYGQQSYSQPQGWAGSMPVATRKRPVWKTVVGVILIVVGALGTLGLLSNLTSGRFGAGADSTAEFVGYIVGTMLVSLIPLALGILLVSNKK